MSHAKVQENRFGHNKLRRRQLGKSSSPPNKMVGLGSDELFISTITDINNMELEINSEDESDENEKGDIQRLIPLDSESVVFSSGKKDNQRNEIENADDETVWSISIQMFIPFLLAGFGMVAASLLLDVVQHWPVYQVVSEVYILVPALLGLKGNLEMTLASRLSTQANLGQMDTTKQQWTLVMGNLALIQCQAMVVGLLASLAAVILGWIPEAHFDIHHGLLLCASALITASVASFVLGLVMVAVILLSRRMNINPDNVATPIAASLGDLTTLALLSWIASILYKAIGSAPWAAPLLIAYCVFITPVWGYIAARNPFTKEVLDYGWTPVISAMLISSLGGLILDYTISSYKGIAVFQLVINGVGGNLVAVQASRISTSLHKDYHTGVQKTLNICISPFHAFFAKGGHARTARVLLMMVIPGHLIFKRHRRILHQDDEQAHHHPEQLTNV
ncbi:PREDICTED: solute carrier family 41 member 1-like [Atta cephalotes]|uniref:SLC41A/MgtE integral membrane domain-containing protein n=1 Tax=Atta cephalotes TaxID=12957 RepID=A0A158NDZ5_ATTCE|nr:PREDICTED: solute carrier family 41 member 1-like [Atta cephalotes]